MVAQSAAQKAVPGMSETGNGQTGIGDISGDPGVLAFGNGKYHPQAASSAWLITVICFYFSRARVFSKRVPFLRERVTCCVHLTKRTIRTKRPAQFSCPTHLSDLASSTPVWRFQFRLVPVQENNTRRQTFDPAGPLRVKTDRTGQSVHKMLQVNKFKISSPSPCVCEWRNLFIASTMREKKKGNHTNNGATHRPMSSVQVNLSQPTRLRRRCRWCGSVWDIYLIRFPFKLRHLH